MTHFLEPEWEELKELTDQQKVFVVEYVADLNATRAAREAGYTNPKSAAAKLKKNRKVAAAIRAVGDQKLRTAELSSEAILEQLRNFLFRDIADFVDEDGYLKSNIKDLPPHARQCIDSWEHQDEFDDDGKVCGQKIKVKLVSKQACLEMAMKYRNLLTGDTTVNNFIGIDWNKFYGVTPEDTQIIDAKLSELESEGDK